MSMTGRFDPDFNKIDNRPEGDLPRDTFEEIAAREAREAEEQSED